MSRFAWAMLTAAFILALPGCAQPKGALFASERARPVWPAPPETPRIRSLGAIGDTRDLKPAVSAQEALLTAVRGRRPPIRFVNPHGVAVRDSSGGPMAAIVAIADSSAGAVHILDLSERTHVLVSGWSDQRFGVPVGVAWAGERLFVTDAKRGEVVELTGSGGFVRGFGRDEAGEPSSDEATERRSDEASEARRHEGTKAPSASDTNQGANDDDGPHGGFHDEFGTPPIGLRRPVGIAYVAAREQLFVVEGDAHRIGIFNLQGTRVGTIGGPGSAPGLFNYPTHIACLGDRLVVADSGNFRVQLLDLDGRCLRTIGKKGNAAGDFALPKGVAFDHEGHIYVVDSHFENVQVFDEQGLLLLAFGNEGRGLGAFWLPSGIAIDGHDRVWVADSGNRRLQVFQYLRAAS